MFNFKKFLKEGGIEKYLLEAQFGNDIESRYQYIRPLMSRLPDSARTEAMLDGMEEARAEDDKQAFDFYFVETMKMLGLEQELMEPDDAMSEPDYEDYAPDSALGPNPSFVEEGESLVNPEAEEIDAEDLDAAADYFDSLAENDDVLEQVALKYQDIITGYYDELARDCFNVQEHRLEMKTECVIRSAYFRATRRYAQWITKQEGIAKESLDIKGLEFRKANFPPIFGKFFNDILEMILKGTEQKEIDDLILNFRKKIMSKDTDITLLGNPTSVKTLNEYNDIYSDLAEQGAVSTMQSKEFTTKVQIANIESLQRLSDLKKRLLELNQSKNTSENDLSESLRNSKNCNFVSPSKGTISEVLAVSYYTASKRTTEKESQGI